MAASPLSFSSPPDRRERPSARSAPLASWGRFSARTTLTPGDRIVLRAIAEAMFSHDGDVEGFRLDAHLDEVDAFISAASKPIRAGLRIALFMVRIAPVLFFFRLRMIEKLDIDERVHVLGRLERSSLANLSLAFIGWRTVMTLVFYEHPLELERLGYNSERKVYKRHLALTAPPAEESGVRLRDLITARDSGTESAARDSSDENKVA